MPRKTKEKEELNEEKVSVVKKAKKPTDKKPANKTKSDTKTTKTGKTSKTTAKATDKKVEAKSTTTSSKKTTTSKKASSIKTKASTTPKKSIKDDKTKTSKKKTTEDSKKEEPKKEVKNKTEKKDEKVKTTKTNNKKSNTTKTTKPETKKVSTKSTKKTKATTPKGKESLKEKSKKKTDEKKEVVQKVEPKKEVIKEETVIEKIKKFLAKIVAMQEEARQETEAKKIKNTTEEDNEIKEDDVEENNKIASIQNMPYMLEYYDLPYRYNETVVKILAQTPKKLFVYWDISDEDRAKLLKAFGERFFEETYPVLLVHNIDNNYTFEVTINDFANSWYLDINDPKSTYVIELGRKFKSKPTIVNIAKTEETKNIVLHNDYVPITISNVLEVPNDHILFERLPLKVLYRNVKTNKETVKEIKHIETTYGKSYDIKEFYEENYKDEIAEGMFDMANPSSRLSSSTFK